METLRKLLLKLALRQRYQIAWMRDHFELAKYQRHASVLSKLNAELNLASAQLENGADKPHVVILEALGRILLVKRSTIWALASWGEKHYEVKPQDAQDSG